MSDQGESYLAAGCTHCGIWHGDVRVRPAFIITERVGSRWWTCPMCQGNYAEVASPLPAVTPQAADEVPVHWPTAWRDVLLERHRQTVKEGWTARHDDKHDAGAMALAAACYACNAATWAKRGASIPAADYTKFSAPGFRWPWAMKWWKPKTIRQDLVRAGALILAEIERRDRAKVSHD